MVEPPSEPKAQEGPGPFRALRWAAVLLSGPILSVLLNWIDWDFLPSGRGPLDLTVEIIVSEITAGFKLTIAWLVCLLVFRILFWPSRGSRNMTVMLPVLLWALESTGCLWTYFHGLGEWSPAWTLIVIFLGAIVSSSLLAAVLLSALVHLVERGATSATARRFEARMEAAPLVTVGVVVATVVLDWLLFSLMSSEAALAKIGP